MVRPLAVHVASCAACQTQATTSHMQNPNFGHGTFRYVVALQLALKLVSTSLPNFRPSELQACRHHAAITSSRTHNSRA